ncbi:MAG TPA: type II toxin-antitoxin system VapC family toxin [Dehalococcoidia bacterium]|nr:type II toxin-antitoxin system VapC family toxin [Dehalococcoidia bacterium]
MIVLDASALVCVLLESPVDRATRINERLGAEDIQAPHVIDLEVTHALRRFVLGRELTPERAAAALRNLAEFPIERHPQTPLLEAIWRMRTNRTSYDAAYVALAEILEAPLVTLDARMARTPAAVPIEVF